MSFSKQHADEVLPSCQLLFIKCRDYYSVYLESIAVNGQTLAIDPAVFTSHKQMTIVDSGTALAYLPDDAYEAF
jgi:kinase